MKDDASSNISPARALEIMGGDVFQPLKTQVAIMSGKFVSLVREAQEQRVKEAVALLGHSEAYALEHPERFLLLRAHLMIQYGETSDSGYLLCADNPKQQVAWRTTTHQSATEPPRLKVSECELQPLSWQSAWAQRWNPSKDSWLPYPDASDVWNALFDLHSALYHLNLTGGLLHIITDDENASDSDLGHCRESANRHLTSPHATDRLQGHIALAMLEILTPMTPKQRIDILRQHDLYDSFPPQP